MKFGNKRFEKTEYKKMTFKVCHKKIYVDCRISEYYVIFVYFQAAVSAQLAVSALYVEKNENKDYVIHSLCFKSNTVKKRLVSHFDSFIVVA